MKAITLYICDKCGAEYRKRATCEKHEKECHIHDCTKCDHHYLAYGCEWNCELANKGKRCKFKAKGQSK